MEVPQAVALVTAALASQQRACCAFAHSRHRSPRAPAGEEALRRGVAAPLTARCRLRVRCLRGSWEQVLLFLQRHSDTLLC